MGSHVTFTPKISKLDVHLEYIQVPLLGRAQRAPHLWVKRKFVYLFIYIYMVRAYSVYIFCPICA